MADVEYPVAIAGGGPVGLALALGLARQGVRSVVLEKAPETRPFSRALGVLARTLEIFRGWGVLDEFLAAGALRTEVEIYTPGHSKPAAVVDLSSQARITATPGILILPQSGTEQILLRSARASGLADIRFGQSIRGFREDAGGVTVEVDGGSGSAAELRATYLVGCDGAHSTVREQLGWPLEGRTYPTRIALADVVITDERDELPWPRVAAIGDGAAAMLRFEPGHWRIIRPLPESSPEGETLSEAATTQSVEALLGPGPFETEWSSVTRIHCRTSPHFRRGRVFLAGDAAHINSPAGGQGMNSGIQDAHNLAWKLTRALKAGSPEAAEPLLLSYEQERRGAVISDVDRYTDLLTRSLLTSPAWMRGGVLSIARAAVSSRSVMAGIARKAGMLDTRYGPSAILPDGGHPIGSRAPDGPLRSASGEVVRVMDLAGPDAALLLFDDGRLPGWSPERVRETIESVPGVRVFRITTAGEAAASPETFRDSDGSVWNAWHATGSTAALVRPDGYVGWMAERPSEAQLRTGVRLALGMGRGGG